MLVCAEPYRPKMGKKIAFLVAARSLPWPVLSFSPFLIKKFIKSIKICLMQFLPALGSWLQHKGQAGLPGAACELERRAGVLRLEREEAPGGGGMGICCQGRTGAYVPQALTFFQTETLSNVSSTRSKPPSRDVFRG